MGEARPDLAAMLGTLGRALMAMETPILREHGVSMWGYAVLTGLEGQPVRTQAALAEAIGADKTRLIPVLDALQAEGLIDRQAAPDDRRARVLTITDEGARRRDAVRAAIRDREDRLLDLLTPAQRDGFLGALRVLSALPREKLSDPS